MKRNKLLICCLLLLFSIAKLYSVPAQKGIFSTFKQPDGDTLVLTLNGNERFHYWSTTDGIPVVKDPDGYYYYAQAIDEKNFIRSEYIARNIDKRSLAEIQYINNAGSYLRSLPLKVLYPTNYFFGDDSIPTTGQLKGLVILAQFLDRTFTDICTQEQMQRQLNEENYSDFGMSGSARDYFIDQSNGKFTPNFDVVGPVTVSRNISYYGEDNQGVYDIHLGQFVKEACELVSQQGEIDFSDYDNNNDGEADLVFVIYAGYAQSSGAPSYTIWPQMWFLDKLNADIVIDGVKINRFACASELFGNSGKQLAGIGTFCHEFGHVLGLADIYNYNGKLSMGAWNIMDYGSYNNDTRTPSGYSSFEKISLGWMDPTELIEAETDIELLPLETSNQAYKLSSPNNENEYFLLENRQKTGRWDKYIEGKGMLILHVNYDEVVWSNNDVNANANNMRMHIIPANGDFSSTSETASIPFPGIKEKDRFTSLTTPSSVFSDDYLLDKPITHIREEGETILFDFLQRIKAPIALGPTNLQETSFTSNWEKVEEAQKYIVLLVNKETGEEKIVQNIVKPRFTFSNLDIDGLYTYKVKAVGNELFSDYSNEITVDMKDTGIEELVQPQISIYSQGKTVYIKSDSTVDIFSVYYGKLLHHLCPIEASNGITLASGIYIIQTKGIFEKILIK